VVLQGEPKNVAQHENHNISEMREYFCTKFCSHLFST